MKLLALRRCCLVLIFLGAPMGTYAGVRVGESEASYVDLGGAVRERAEYFSRNTLSRGSYQDEFLLSRLVLNADMKYEDASAYIQLGNHEEWGRDLGPERTDVNHADVQQLFVGYSFKWGSDEWITRVGRREMVFGNSRLISLRDGPNIHLAFDGAFASLNSGSWKTDLFAVRPVLNEPGQFNDSANRDQYLLGLYASVKSKGASQEYYFLEYGNHASKYANELVSERRETLGARWFGRENRAGYELELILQGGTISDRDIRAFAIIAASDYALSDLRYTPMLKLKVDVASGDKSKTDGYLSTFNPLFQAGSYFSEAAVITLSNVIAVTTSVKLNFTRDIGLDIGVSPLWRYSTQDGVYAMPYRPVITDSTSGERYIGWQNQWLLNWRLNDRLTLKFACVNFHQGGFVRQAGGGSLNYAQSSVTFSL